MEIVFVRHAQPQWVKDGLAVDDPPLTEVGFRQADRLAEQLAAEEFDEILVSPLVRTRQTATPWLERIGAPLVVEPWLEEIRNPVWHGTPEEKAAAAWQAERSKTSTERWEGLDGGEKVSDFVERINIGTSLFLEERGVLRRDTDLPVWQTGPGWREEHKVALVCHAGTSSVAICHMLGLQPTPWEWERFHIAHATVSRVRTFALGDGVTFGLRALSDDEHLPRDLRTA